MVSLHAAGEVDRVALENLMQLYAYDWSELADLDVGHDGRFQDYPLEPWFRDDWRHPFLVRVGEKLAGFALIQERSRLSGARGVFDMAEFFVMRRYRRRGVGLTAAALAFARFRGSWEVRQRERNEAATAFWRRAIGSYTGGRFDEVFWKDETWTGPVQRFST